MLPGVQRFLALSLALSQDPSPGELCADCHPAQVASFRQSGMARALEELHPGELADLTEVLERDTGFRYRFEASSAGAQLVETRAAENGRPPHRDSAPVAFAIGAGELDRSYALVHDGRLWMAPLEVVSVRSAERSETEQRHTALAPGHTMTPGTRSSLPITPECLGCHTDSPPPRTWPLNLRPANPWRPSGISCGGCHAGLAEHVRFRSEELSGERSGAAGQDPILAPDREGGLDREARMSICAACHLQGDVRIELDPERLGPPPPGTDLLDTRAVFVAAQPTDEIGFVSHVQRLVLSRCYLESAVVPAAGSLRALSCESCHDPHRSVFAPEERQRVRAACANCHAGGGSASACSLVDPKPKRGHDCVACHLRRTGVFDVAEVEIHDHWIQKQPGPPSPRKPLRFPESSTGEWKRFAWPDAPAPAHENDPGLALMALAHGGFVERARALVDAQPGARVAELPMYHHVRASLLEQAGRLPEARAAYARALELDPELAESAVNLGPLLARLGEPRAGLALLDRLIAAHPRADTALRNRAAIKLALGDEAGFLSDLETAMRVLPDATLADALARFHEQRGDADGARRWSDEARRLDPRRP